MAIQETWDIKDLKSLSLQSYHDLVFKSRSLSRGGGIGFYINKNLKLKLLMNIQLLMNASLNLFVLKLSSLKINLLFSCLYICRPPSHNILSNTEQSTAFLETLENLLSMLSNSKREVFILTDNNIDLLSINSNSLSSNYLEKLLS